MKDFGVLLSVWTTREKERAAVPTRFYHVQTCHGNLEEITQLFETLLHNIITSLDPTFDFRLAVFMDSLGLLTSKLLVGVRSHQSVNCSRRAFTQGESFLSETI